MSVRQLRRVLWLLMAAFLAGVVVLVLWAVREPQVDESRSGGGRMPATRPATASTGAHLTLAAYEPLWNLQLRRPLYDPPPILTTAPVAPPPAPLTCRLVGTILEPQQALGLFVDAEGKVQMKAVGQKVGEAQILSIERDRAEVLYNGRNQTLVIPREPAN